jgi:RNA polymerase sigma factor (sigma-70 family)
MGKTARSDAELVRETLEGHRAAFDALIERHFGLVYVIALARLDDPERAEDLAQEVFLRSYVHLAQLNPPSKFPAWLSRIARNLAIDWLRRGQRASRLLPMIPMEALPGEIADPKAKGVREAMAETEESQTLQRALSALPHDQREIVMLRFTEGLSQSEIADRLGLHQTTVSRVIKRALASLRGQLEPILRETGPSLRPSVRATVKTVAAIAAFEAMVPAAKAALVAAASTGVGGTAATAKASAALGGVSLFASLSGWIAGGAKVMATGKGIAAAAVAVAAIGGGTYQVMRSSEPAPPPALVGMPAMPMVAIPAGSFEMGLSDGEMQTLATHRFVGDGAPDRSEMERWIDRGLPFEEMARAIGATPTPSQSLLDLTAFVTNRPDRPPHRVTLDAFHMSATEVTAAQHMEFVRATGYPLPEENISRSHLSNPEMPITGVSWDDAMAYCAWLTDTQPGTYCLPTEAEWEYVCRAGTTTLFAFGDTLDPEAAHFSHEIHGVGPLDVGSFLPNAWGLRDMHGNVSEWCLDLFSEDFYSDPQATSHNPISDQPERGLPSHSVRGGGWVDVSDIYPGGLLCRSSFRGPAFAPDFRADDLGFRVVWFDAEPDEIRGAETVQAAFEVARTRFNQTPSTPSPSENTVSLIPEVFAVDSDGQLIALAEFDYEDIQRWESRMAAGEDRAALINELELPSIPQETHLIVRFHDIGGEGPVLEPSDALDFFDMDQVVLEDMSTPSLGVEWHAVPDATDTWEVDFQNPLVGDVLAVGYMPQELHVSEDGGSFSHELRDPSAVRLCLARFEEPPSSLLGSPRIERRPQPAQFSRGALTSLPEPGAVGIVDLRASDLSTLDLRDSRDPLLMADFGSATQWPPDDRMPTGFDPERIMELGRDPGLGIRTLHAQGITGRGVAIGIIDQPMLVDHREYGDRMRLYEELNVEPGTVSQMHGPAVVSLAAGETVGVAPGADLYCLGIWSGTWQSGEFEFDHSHTARAVRRLLAINEDLPEGSKIRVVALARGWDPSQAGYAEIAAAAQEVREAGILLVCSSLREVHGFRFQGLGRPPLADPNDFRSYEPGLFWAARFSGNNNALLVPMDSRTTASFTAPDHMAFDRSGGWSWAIPHIAGLYALTCQVDPDITPDRFWELAIETGHTQEIEWRGQTLPLGPIVNPVALIEALQGD